MPRDRQDKVTDHPAGWHPGPHGHRLRAEILGYFFLHMLHKAVTGGWREGGPHEPGVGGRRAVRLLDGASVTRVSCLTDVLPMLAATRAEAEAKAALHDFIDDHEDRSRR